MKNPIYRTGFPTAETKNRLRPSLNLAYAFVIALCVLLLIKIFARSGVLLVIMYMGILLAGFERKTTRHIVVV